MWHLPEWIPALLLGHPERSAVLSDRDARVVSFAQFVAAFSWNFVYVFLPFYVLRISPYDRETTLLWTGLILGVTGVASTLFAPLWGAMASRVSPKLLYEVGILIQVGLFACFALTTSLPVLFLLRMAIGMVGGTSTMGLILVSAVSGHERITSNVGTFQSAMTLGQISGPFVGAFAVDLVGFAPTFLLGSLVLLIDFLAVRLGVPWMGRLTPRPPEVRITRRRFVAGWLVCFTATLQLVFLPSVLPEILGELGVAGASAVRVAGGIVFAYGLAAAVGAVLVSRSAGRFGRRRTVLVAGGLASLLQVALWLPNSVGLFAAVRILQCALIAGVIPIVFAQVTEGAPGGRIGLMNTSRFSGNAAGPLLATLFFAHFSPLLLYGTLAVLTGVSLAAFYRAPLARGRPA
jgi:DHA1 family multidrug resistance protein-like MFS transporter